ncbi:MAG: hypothetical protein J0L53_13755 [Spirochaetes bacterium]|nr:hypothetical protein [Spirochaetota bacterium]
MLRRSAFFLILAFAVPAFADLANGRSLPIGDRSAFMANTGVADGRGSMAVLFNPGALGFVERSKIALSGNLYFNQWTDFDPLVRYGGESQSVRLSGFNSLPNSAVSIYKWGETTLAISVLVPDFSEIGTLQKIDLTNYKAVVQFNSKEQDLWIGATIARVWREKYGIGLSVYGTRYSQRSAVSVIGSVTSGGTATELTSILNIEGAAHSIETVLGAFVKPMPWLAAGLKIAAPGIRISGSGSYYASTRATQGATQSIQTEDKPDIGYYYRRPAEFSLGFAVFARDDLRWYFDTNLQMPVTFEESPSASNPGLYDLRATLRLSTGVEYRLTPAWSFLSGGAFLPSAVPALEPRYAGRTRATECVGSAGIIYSDEHVRTGLGAFYFYADGDQQVDATPGNISHIRSTADVKLRILKETTRLHHERGGVDLQIARDIEVERHWPEP